MCTGTLLLCFGLYFPDCGQLQNPNKGQVDMTQGSAYQAVARYMCNQGYELIGDEERVCRATGTWSGIQPTCLMKGNGRTCLN